MVVVQLEWPLKWVGHLRLSCLCAAPTLPPVAVPLVTPGGRQESRRWWRWCYPSCPVEREGEIRNIFWSTDRSFADCQKSVYVPHFQFCQFCLSFIRIKLINEYTVFLLKKKKTRKTKCKMLPKLKSKYNSWLWRMILCAKMMQAEAQDKIQEYSKLLFF